MHYEIKIIPIEGTMKWECTNLLTNEIILSSDFITLTAILNIKVKDDFAFLTEGNRSLSGGD